MKKNKTILIIDDNKDILDALQLLLEDAGYFVILSENGLGLNRLEKNLPNVILLDMLLSGSDGRDLIHELKTQESTKNAPIILNSAHPTAKNIWKEAGADDFIAKPFDINVLLSVIEKHI